MNLRIPEQNKVFLAGRLTRDPDLRYTPKGQPICRFDLAVNRRYKNGGGEWQEETAFVPIVIFWREMAERCAERLKKASPVLVEGRLQTRKWETKNGEPRSTLEVIAQRVQFLSKEDILPEEEPAPQDVKPSGSSQDDSTRDPLTEEQPLNSKEDLPF